MPLTVDDAFVEVTTVIDSSVPLAPTFVAPDPQLHSSPSNFVLLQQQSVVFLQHQVAGVLL